MASPWKFLARLVSPRRERQEENGTHDTVKPEVSTSSEPPETVDPSGLNSGDQPASQQPQSHSQSDVVSTEPKLAADTASRLQNTGGSERTKTIEVAEPASSEKGDFGVKAIQDASTSSPTGAVTKRKLSKRRKRAETVAVVASPVVPTFSDDAMGLDDEIRLLRDQLITKLRQQNAQLKKMLGRFER
ncbi:hypothetical protein QO002_005245 [Pararhizobium capsulatum DSM 1112]|uniref:Transcriptional regulator n=1 Tax=Pararhizobium capsulatum DSM 1112 TaxID=1121113 RepID=A0ABU0BXP4_9HYPH|nr:hypothetical protein [Pararhizobium capsulatum]MDQ0323039.1 hypothetical protein [Pararhizobium capsulatum DSM 1112]